MIGGYPPRRGRVGVVVVELGVRRDIYIVLEAMYLHIAYATLCTIHKDPGVQGMHGTLVC
jgi:hypothetical protein